MTGNRRAATLITILVLAAWPSGAWAAGSSIPQLTTTAPSGLQAGAAPQTTPRSNAPAPKVGSRPAAAAAARLPHTGMDVWLEVLLGFGLLGTGLALRPGCIQRLGVRRLRSLV
jgi:hypothetical protein